MDVGLVADILVNVFGAAGAFVLAGEARRIEPRGSLTRRIDWALRFVALLFLVRAIAWASGDGFALGLADVIAAVTPLVSLVVAEGMLRRHAPRGLKLAIAAGPLVVLLVKLLPFVPLRAENAVLIGIVVGGFAAVAHLLWRRDAASLTKAENASVNRVLVSLVVLAPLILTDFRAVVPEVPVRLGALGALLLLYLAFSPGNLKATLQSQLGTLAIFALVAGALAFGYVLAEGAAATAASAFRAGAVALSGLLFAAIVAEARGARSAPFAAGKDLARASTPAEFETALRADPLLSEARVLSGTELAEVRDAAFVSLMTERPTLHKPDAPWGRLASDDGVERALSLMTACDATELCLVTAEPLRLLALSLPAVARDAQALGRIELARLAGALAYAKVAP